MAANAPSRRSIPHIPPEMFRHITQYLADPSDLLSASLAASILRDAAQRILFRHPSQILFPQKRDNRELGILHKLSIDRYSAFLDAILSAPDRLGLLVRTYTHRHFHNSLNYEQQCDYVERVNKALRAMINLKRLAFSIELECDLSARVLHGCTFQLDAFDWGQRSDTDQVFQDFLPTQPSLKHLTFHCYATEETRLLAASGLCPELKSLTGGRDAIDLFLKGRNVTYLRWVDNEPVNDIPKPLSNNLDAEFAQIQCVTYIPHDWENHLIPKVLDKFCSLVVLETLAKSVEGANNLILLSKLTSLRVLILRIATYGSGNSYRETPSEGARDILTSCPKLSYVDIEIRRGTFQRFTHTSLASTSIGGSTVTEDDIQNSCPDSDSTCSSTPISNLSYPKSCVHAFASISAFNGVPRFPVSIFDLLCERDFGQWFILT